MIVLQQFNVAEERCFYLPDRPNRLEYEMVFELTPEEYEAKMNAGYRKFGPFLFHPVCDGCRECRPIRILADQFTPNRSQRRALRANADLTIRYQRTTLDDRRLDLYNRYHRWREESRGWPPTEKGAEDYAFTFLENSLPGVEISAWDGGRLLAVALTEITPNTVSGIYHYHDPDEGARSLGKLVMLHTIELARRLEKPYAYFGYYVADCGSLNYKASFRPCEVLDADGQWRPLNGPESEP
jgi:leucyl-tRNA---protein transferase